MPERTVLSVHTVHWAPPGDPGAAPIGHGAQLEAPKVLNVPEGQGAQEMVLLMLVNEPAHKETKQRTREIEKKKRSHESRSNECLQRTG